MDHPVPKLYKILNKYRISPSHGLTASLTWIPQSEVLFVPTVGLATAENMNSLTMILGNCKKIDLPGKSIL